MFKILSIIVLFTSLVNTSLVIGKITTKDSKILGNASIVWSPSGKGDQFDDNGMLMLPTSPLDRVIIVNYIGYVADTIQKLDIQYQISLLNALRGIYMLEFHKEYLNLPFDIVAASLIVILDIIKVYFQIFLLSKGICSFLSYSGLSI